jgi:adenylate cyclase 3
LSFLGDEFEVEAAHGEKREQVLRTAGIETYFILRARNEVKLRFDPLNTFSIILF